MNNFNSAADDIICPVFLIKDYCNVILSLPFICENKFNVFCKEYNIFLNLYINKNVWIFR